jgi:small subunit ribosomal protein S17
MKMSYSKEHRKKRGHRNIGMSAKAPERKCSDPKCPWHGTVPLRGRTFTGEVVSSRAPKTATVEWGFPHYLPKFERYERRHSRVNAYNPECIAAKQGDTVRIAECRPLSKTKSFIVIEVLKT